MSDYLVKVIIIGDSGVGKTNLLTRFCENNYKQTYVATIGVDFKIKTVMINDKKIKLQIWDTAGQERFKNITQTYYKGVAGIILAYSINDRKSFESVERWINQIQEHAPQNVNKILVATKSDLEDQRVVSQQSGSQLANKYRMPFLQVSAKSGHQVKDVFQILTSQIVKCQMVNQQFRVNTQLGKRQFLKNTPGIPQRNCSC